MKLTREVAISNRQILWTEQDGRHLGNGASFVSKKLKRSVCLGCCSWPHPLPALQTSIPSVNYSFIQPIVTNNPHTATIQIIPRKPAPRLVVRCLLCLWQIARGIPRVHHEEVPDIAPHLTLGILAQVDYKVHELTHASLPHPTNSIRSTGGHSAITQM